MDRCVITPNLFNFFVSCQLICTLIAGLISSLDWPSKTTPNWLLTSWKPLTSSQVTVISCYVSWFVQLFLIRIHHYSCLNLNLAYIINYTCIYDRCQPTSFITKVSPIGCSNIFDQSEYRKWKLMIDSSLPFKSYIYVWYKIYPKLTPHKLKSTH